MSLLVTKCPLVFNLPAIFRDFDLTPAELKNLIEGSWLSADSQNEASARREDVYFGEDTKCDGYLLSYSFDSLSEFVEFEQYALSLGYDFEKKIHIMHSYCLWIKEVNIDCVKDGEPLKLVAIRHVDDSRNELHLNRKLRAEISRAEDFVIETRTIRLSLDYIDYQDRSVFQYIWDSVRSLFYTGFSHVHHFRPRLHDLAITHEKTMTLSGQVLPGLLSLVPQGELYHAVKFESKVPYMSTKP
ncbi:hypothetical protein [Pseudoalteromonas marina]|uniref:DUF38 domain-containing protein n=1 Tax=Pseudoalteromonas marina TaxID=267375 RepID=A0ABT9FI21_9GAMM|nr:hypothetical protein [Pseudoalteromonas marina]MDP2566388.1 hypothetical protein [Pseudoalteromonas marina]